MNFSGVSVRLILRFVGVFVMGLACGTLVTPFSSAPSSLEKFFAHTSDPKERADMMMRKFTDKFHLTQDEQNKIEPIVLQMSETIFKTRACFGTDVMSIEDEYHQKMFVVLTPEHRALFETTYATYRKHLSDAILISTSPAAEKAPYTNPALASTPSTKTSQNP